ncbi:MFS transporter [Ureibacillus aquaedulcis]|uniref:MFS transporter n=1 Tax=Ureibacillus aquaedulcis TaxID=3058421 RepID=A0ABT8GT44_9BACL|nr:MFS transporter [Ureibacillus sp. BA0131]MDN4494585.1 MFS transporter [Ureibacillus sp. BA0131]
MPKKTFLLLLFIMFLSMTGYGIVLPVLPYFAEELGLTSFQMSSLITGWAFTQFLVLPLWGKIIDKVGRKPVLLFGMVGFGIAFVLMILAESYWQLLSIRIIGAILSSGTLPAVLALVADTNDDQTRGAAMSKMSAANGIGFLVGPAVGSAFVPFGITIPFIVAGVLSLITIPFVALFIQEPSKNNQGQEQIPITKSLVYSFKPGYFMLFMITLGISISISSILGILGYFMIEKFDSSATLTGWAFTAQSAAAVIVQIFLMSWLYRHINEESITKYGIIITAVGFLFLVLPVHVSFVFIGVFIIGVGQALIRPTLLTLLSKKEDLGRGMVMSLHGAYDSLGRSIGPLIAGWLFMVNEIAPFIMSCILCLILFLIMLSQDVKLYRFENKSKEV